MIWLFTLILTYFATYTQSSSPTPPPAPEFNETQTVNSETTSSVRRSKPSEDEKIINETTAKYGLPRNYQQLGLPGPELRTDDEIMSIENKFSNGNPEAYTLKVRTITKFFSYNGRYEEAQIMKDNGRQKVVTLGQFGEHFKRKTGGFYIRTIGYTLDDNGYQHFLIDLTRAKIRSKHASHIGGKQPISSTVLASLIGGNSLG